MVRDNLNPQSNLQHLLAILFIVLISLWYLLPLFQHLDDAFVSPASNGDAVQYIWNAWEFKKNLISGVNPFYTSDILQPEGGNLLMHTYTPLMSTFCLLFKNPYAGINLFLILNFVLSALGAYLLSFRLTKRILPSILTALIFAYAPNKMMHFANHYNLMMTAVIPFYILVFLRTFTFEYGKLFPSCKSIGALLAVLGLGIISALGDFYTTFFLIYFSILWALYYKIHPYWTNAKIYLKWGALAVAFILLHVIVHQLVIHGVNDRGGLWWGGDLLSYFIPSENSWLWSRDAYGNFADVSARMEGGADFELFMSYTAILLAGYLIYALIKTKFPVVVSTWAFVLLICFMITLPALRVGGIKIIYLPTSILHFIPFFNNLRCPTRILVMAGLILPLTATMLWYFNVSDKKNLLLKNGVVLALIVLCVLELKTKPFSFLSARQVPEIIQSVKASTTKTLLPIPLGVRDGIKEAGFTNTNLLYYQTIHKKPMLGGYLSRVPDSTYKLYQQDSVCARLMRCSKDAAYTPRPATAEEKNKFFKTFAVNGFLILPEYKGGAGDKYIMSLLEGKRYTRVEKDGVFIQLL